MEFKIAKSVLNNSLATVTKAISSAAPIPALSGVKFEVSNKEVKLLASDSDISILSTLKVEDEANKIEVISEGAIVLDSKIIQDIVRKIDSSIVSIEVIDGAMTKITGNSAKFRINGTKASDYPTISFDTSSNLYKMDVAVFNKIIAQTAFACGESETRPALLGVNFKTSDGKLLCNATNSYRLATKIVDIDKSMDFDITIPKNTLAKVNSILAGAQEFEMSIDSNKITFMVDDIIIRARLIEDAYPDVSRLIPPIFNQSLEISTKDLLSAIERTSFIRSDGKNVVKLEVNGENVTISSNSYEIGSSNEILDIISYKGDPITISCSGEYLSSALKVIESPVSILNFSGELKPIVIKGKDDETLTQLISPMRS